MARNDRSNSASRSAQQNPQELAAAREEWDNAFNDSSENDVTRVLSTHGSYTAPEDGDNRKGDNTNWYVDQECPAPVGHQAKDWLPIS